MFKAWGYRDFFPFFGPFLFHIIWPKSFAQGLVQYLDVDNLAVNGSKRRGKNPSNPFQNGHKDHKKSTMALVTILEKLNVNRSII